MLIIPNSTDYEKSCPRPKYHEAGQGMCSVFPTAMEALGVMVPYTIPTLGGRLVMINAHLRHLSECPQEELWS